MTLAAQDLSFGYPGRTIGAGVTVTVACGEALALLGPNGGGKTTLLKTMLGLLKPHAGMVSLDGLPLTECLSASGRGGSVMCLRPMPGAFAFAVRDVVLMGRTASSGAIRQSHCKLDRSIVDE
jgi:iron complex transport system ATP-binding protein